MGDSLPILKRQAKTKERYKMTYGTETKVIAHIADVDIFQVNKIGKFLNEHHLQFGFDYDRDGLDGRHLYTMTADITGYKGEFYSYIELIAD